MVFKWLFLVLLTNLLDVIILYFGGGVAVQTINRLFLMWVLTASIDGFEV